MMWRKPSTCKKELVASAQSCEALNDVPTPVLNTSRIDFAVGLRRW